ncbi:leucine carboxyl methyltransferase [Punctularia strigosozonata HHB-11173 SS5]|uniref:leucine carboxyl methyltransferase n=1 Tax=Punctularia strigosozonata (strain HHB-11173) TaxID=741275 RepID=UPI0004416650|nr:leucine carboxyl methyltransferase [Punctularia strigosozonata HHB-11173 SS5]EIN06541.1 leucine carboxyl methyltransferase [Punctularia strigosozonata HHB-11173 SS5]
MASSLSFPQRTSRSIAVGPQRDKDAAVRQTDSDAALARLSAVKRGYLHDPFIAHLVPRPEFQTPRPPLINIGTYLRSSALDELVDRWLDLSLQQGKQCQIISLGAGSDTRFWRIASGPKSSALASYVELDLEENVVKKAKAIRKSIELSTVLGDAEQIQIRRGGCELHARKYHLLSADLRKLNTLNQLFESQQTGEAPLLSPGIPVLLIFECVLVYMTPDESNRLIERFADYCQPTLTPLGAVVYEMFNVGDSFGRVMLNNLSARGISLPGATPYPSKQSLAARFLQHGFTGAHALTLRDVRYLYIDVRESERISKLEMLDEVEELDLVLDHYAITWGYSSPTADAALWSTWALYPKSSVQNDHDEEDL